MATVKAQVERILADPINLPPAFLDYMIQYAALNPIPAGAVTAPILNSTGLKGATKASRLVGSTSAGAPTQGTFAVGDLVIAQDGHVWICTLAGSPGTWVDASIAPIQALADVDFAGNIHLHTTGNTMEQGSVLTLKSAVSNPIVAPSLSIYGSGSIGNTTSASADLYLFACYTWVDGGGHESAPSPVSNSINLPYHGYYPLVSVATSIPALPAGATGFRVYGIKQSSSTPPSASALLRQAASTYISSETVSPTIWSSYNSGGASPPGSTTFPAGTAALVKDAAGNTLLSADSTVHGKTLLVAAAISGTTSVTPDNAVGDYFAYSYSGGPGTVTVNAPTHPPSSTQSATLFLDFTNAASGGTLTYGWNAAYQATATTLPVSTATSGTARLMFVWNGSVWLLYTKT